MNFCSKLLSICIFASAFLGFSAHAANSVALFNLEHQGLKYEVLLGEVDSESELEEATQAAAAQLTAIHDENSKSQFRFETLALEVDEGRSTAQLTRFSPKNFVKNVVSRIKNYLNPGRNVEIDIPKTNQPGFQRFFSTRNKLFYGIVRLGGSIGIESLLLVVGTGELKAWIEPILVTGVMLFIGAFYGDVTSDATNKLDWTEIKLLKRVARTGIEAYGKAETTVRKILGMPIENPDQYSNRLKGFGTKVKVFIKSNQSLFTFFLADSILAYVMVGAHVLTNHFLHPEAVSELQGLWWARVLIASSATTISAGVFDNAAFRWKELQTKVGKISKEKINALRIGLTSIDAVTTMVAMSLFNLNEGWVTSWLEGGLLIGGTTLAGAIFRRRMIKLNEAYDLRLLNSLGKEINNAQCEYNMVDHPPLLLPPHSPATESGN